MKNKLLTILADKLSIGLTLAVGLTVSAASMHAAIIPCTNTTIAALIALGSGAGNGCTIDDKLYNNFSYTPLAGAPAATSVNAAVQESLPVLESGFTFTSASGSFGGNFILGFTVTVVPGPPCPLSPCTITTTAEQLFPATSPPGTQAIAVVYTAPNEPTVNINNVTFGNNTGGNVISPGISTITKLATTSGITSTQPLDSFESVVRETPASAVPEPGSYTYMLLGLGLTIVGMSGKWRKKRA